MHIVKTEFIVKLFSNSVVLPCLLFFYFLAFLSFYLPSLSPQSLRNKIKNSQMKVHFHLRESSPPPPTTSAPNEMEILQNGEMMTHVFLNFFFLVILLRRLPSMHFFLYFFDKFKPKN